MSCKNSVFSKYFKKHLYNYEEYMRSTFLLNLTLLNRVISPRLPKIGSIVSWTKKLVVSFLPGKVENNEYPEFETSYSESIDGLDCPIIGYVRISDDRFAQPQGTI